MSGHDDFDEADDGAAFVASVLLLDIFVAVLIARGAFIFSVLWVVLNAPMA